MVFKYRAISILISFLNIVFRKACWNKLDYKTVYALHVHYTGHLIRCGKKWKIMRKFSAIIMRKKVMIMWKRRRTMWQFLKLIKLFPRLFFQTYKIHVNVFLRNLTPSWHVWHLPPFVDRYFFVQHSFSIVFFPPKLSNQALNKTRKTGYWIVELCRSAPPYPVRCPDYMLKREMKASNKLRNNYDW